MSAKNCLLISILGLSIFATACGPAATPVPDTATPEPTTTYTPVPFTLTPTVTLTPTSTPTSTPTQTLTPTETLTPTPTPTSVLNNTALEVVASYGFDPKSGRVIYAMVEPEDLEVNEDSTAMRIFEPLGELEEYVMQYEVNVRNDPGASIYGCGVWLHFTNKPFTEDLQMEGENFLALSAQGMSIWGIQSIKNLEANFLVEPRTASFQFREDKPVKFTFVVKGPEVEIYTSAGLIGRYNSQLTIGKTGLIGHAEGKGDVTCTYENFWIWAAE